MNLLVLNLHLGQNGSFQPVTRKPEYHQNNIQVCYLILIFKVLANNIVHNSLYFSLHLFFVN